MSNVNRSAYPFDPPLFLAALADGDFGEKIAELTAAVAAIPAEWRSRLDEFMYPTTVPSLGDLTAGLALLRKRELPLGFELNILGHPHKLLEDVLDGCDNFIELVEEAPAPVREKMKAIEKSARAELDRLPSKDAYHGIMMWVTAVEEDLDDRGENPEPPGPY